MGRVNQVRPPPVPIRSLIGPYLRAFQGALWQGAQSYQVANPGASLAVTSWWRDAAQIS